MKVCSWRQWGTILIAIAIMRFCSLGAYPILDPTESRYAKIAMLMASDHDWIVPHHEPGIPFWGKPPLSFWLTAFSFKIFGINEFSARLFSFLMCAATVWLTVLLAAALERRSSDRTEAKGQSGFAYFCGAILASTFLFNVSAGFVQTDSALVAVMTISMVSFPLAVLESRRRARLFWGYLFFVGLGLALLTKGPVAVAIEGLAIGIWAIWRREWKAVRSLPWLTGIALILLIAIPWYAAAEIRSPGFLRYFIIGEHWDRFVMPGWKSLYGKSHRLPPGTIWAFYLLAGFPWITLLFCPSSWRIIFRRTDRDTSTWLVYLLCWFLSPLLLFTMARNIMITYVMPGLPAMAILLGWVLAHPVDQGANAPVSTLGRKRFLTSIALLVPAGYLAAAFFIMPRLSESASQWPIIRLYRQLDSNRGAPLAYYGEMPDSAYIYEKGKALLLSDKSAENMKVSLNRQSTMYFVTRDPDEHKFLERCGNRTEELARIGKYILSQETSAATSATRP